MRPLLHDLAHEIAREQIAYWMSLEPPWKVPDAAAALGMRYQVWAWKDIENALAAGWRRLPTHCQFGGIAA